MSAPGERELRELRSELETRLRAADAELDGIRSSRSDSPTDDEHDPEGSTVSADWSRAIALRDSARQALRDTDAALARVADGSYGVCTNCGRPIGTERLRARPATELCIDCARSLG